jgi:hypothetical protein
MNAISTRPCITKSTSEAPIAESGSTSRGKYTFRTRLELSMIERVATFTDAENTFQARSPERMKTGKAGILAGNTRVKTIPKTTR